MLDVKFFDVGTQTVYRASNNIDTHDIITTTLKHIVAPLLMEEGIAAGGELVGVADGGTSGTGLGVPRIAVVSSLVDTSTK